jgi:hypothetical protein
VSNPLEGYESVAERIEKFWNHFPAGRIDTKIFFQDGQRYIVQTDIYRDAMDLIPYATDFAEEIRSNANRFPLENATTSAIGRAFHTGGISKFSDGTPRPSFEEMRRVGSSLSAVPDLPTANTTITVREKSDPWTIDAVVDELGGQIITGQIPPAAPQCKHGSMIHKKGQGAKGPYSGYVCSSKVRAEQCPAKWDN